MYCSVVNLFLDFAQSTALKFVPKGPIDNNQFFSPIRRQAIILTIAYPIHWRIYAALGGD